MFRRYDRYWHILIYSIGTAKIQVEGPPQIIQVFTYYPARSAVCIPFDNCLSNLLLGVGTYWQVIIQKGSQFQGLNIFTARIFLQLQLKPPLLLFISVTSSLYPNGHGEQTIYPLPFFLCSPSSFYIVEDGLFFGEWKGHLLSYCYLIQVAWIKLKIMDEYPISWWHRCSGSGLLPKARDWGTLRETGGQLGGRTGRGGMGREGKERGLMPVSRDARWQKPFSTSQVRAEDVCGFCVAHEEFVDRAL